MPPAGSRKAASWERVLAAMEAEAARAAALLVADDAFAAAGIEYEAPDAVPLPTDAPASVPATWRLPVSAAGGSAAGRPNLTAGAAARAVAGYAAAAATAPPRLAVQPGVPASTTGALDANTVSEAARVSPATATASPATAADATGVLAAAAVDPVAAKAGEPIRPYADAPAAQSVAAERAAADFDSTPGDFELPNPADMPPMDAEQQQRFEALHARITALQSELATAMGEAEEVLARLGARRTEREPRPELVDRRL